MKLIPTRFDAVYLVELTPVSDARGFFAEAYHADVFEKAGLVTSFVQSNLAYNHLQGTLRGMHYQEAPHAETKLVRCIRGAVFDVVVDIRPQSATCGQWQGFELTAENRLALYMAEGFAHGYQTLVDDTELLYQVSAFYHPPSAKGYCYNDPAFNIQWPLPCTVISERDTQHPAFRQMVSTEGVS